MDLSPYYKVFVHTIVIIIWKSLVFQDLVSLNSEILEFSALTNGIFSWNKQLELMTNDFSPEQSVQVQIHTF